jgi:hypothetical protein
MGGAEMPKPVGVIIIAVFEFIAAAGATLLGLVALLGMGFLARILEQNGTIPSSMVPVLMGGGVVIAVLCFIIAGLFGFLGYGMLNLRSWARTVTMVLAIIGIVMALLGITAGAFRFGVFAVIFNGIRLAVNALILWYLNQPHVKLAFRVGALPTAPPGGVAGSMGPAR